MPHGRSTRAWTGDARAHPPTHTGLRTHARTHVRRPPHPTPPAVPAFPLAAWAVRVTRWRRPKCVDKGSAAGPGHPGPSGRRRAPGRPPVAHPSRCRCSGAIWPRDAATGPGFVGGARQSFESGPASRRPHQIDTNRKGRAFTATARSSQRSGCRGECKQIWTPGQRLVTRAAGPNRRPRYNQNYPSMGSGGHRRRDGHGRRVRQPAGALAIRAFPPPLVRTKI